MLTDRISVHRNELKLEGLGFTNPRSFVNEESIRELADDIETKKAIVENIVAWRTEGPNGPELIVLDGKRRTLALDVLISEGRSKGLEESVPVVVFEGSKAEAQMMALSSIHKEPLPTFDIAKALYELSENENVPQKDLAKQINKSQPYISRLLTTYRKAGGDLLKVWRDSDIPLDTVMDIASIPEEDQIAAIKEQISTRSKGGKRAASEARAKVKSASGQNPRPSSKQITELLVLGDTTNADNSSNPYVRGLMDGLKFANGLVGLGEFENAWSKHLQDTRIASGNKRRGDDVLEIE